MFNSPQSAWKSRIETGALLGGLIYDDRGNIMSPTYSIRRGNRYRYYISSALLHDRRPDAGSLARINADDVERLVVAVLGRELSRPHVTNPPAIALPAGTNGYAIDWYTAAGNIGWSLFSNDTSSSNMKQIVLQNSSLANS